MASSFPANLTKKDARGAPQKNPTVGTSQCILSLLDERGPLWR